MFNQTMHTNAHAQNVGKKEPIRIIICLFILTNAFKWSFSYDTITDIRIEAVNYISQSDFLLFSLNKSLFFVEFFSLRLEIWLFDHGPTEKKKQTKKSTHVISFVRI